ncbi:uncharacterized protein FA14DRAFT_54376 [Meira miltonrushii]|uniref:Uncharacterized protein n=1 Tax=Meira miltonrushii TaxID=1280837 RepID=A0A316VGA7_9BASI|nr:uncharacterized protein FA14DRAFT_54376 [Meira miltonrushii]PWN36354.1 hypothetical protein FA14DRAFT_54376 [Meira miltonrushii]
MRVRVRVLKRRINDHSAERMDSSLTIYLSKVKVPRRGDEGARRRKEESKQASKMLMAITFVIIIISIDRRDSWI